ncbi:MAG: GNAT family N-acetyltransferase [Candidatus Heimdallarchaeota archaeon]|nr:GNAT family N-acetyltransferase [Candidatus Heimdallarchaeota archaeon]
MFNITFKGEPYVGTKVRLRAVEMEDVNAIMEHWNDYDSRKYLGNTIPMSTKMEEDWVNYVHNLAKSQKGYHFVIENKETKEFLGTCGLEDINWINRSATLGIGIHNPVNHNQGYGTDTMLCLIKFGFWVLNLHRIELWVYEYNERGIHVYEKVGFKKVGKKREAAFFEGKYYDIIEMDILYSEFQNGI